MLKSIQNKHDFLNDIKVNKNKFDILIMNISPKDTSGIDLAYVAQEQNPQIKIIFTSEDSSLLEDIYIKICPYAFISKPVNIDLLYFHLDNINKAMSQKETKYFIINNRNTFAKIPYSNILYFESQKRKLFVHTINEVYALYKKIDEIENTAPDYFIRCHQSYLINPYYTKGAISKNSFELITGQRIPISRSRLAEAQKLYFELEENKF